MIIAHLKINENVHGTLELNFEKLSFDGNIFFEGWTNGNRGWTDVDKSRTIVDHRGPHGN